MIRLKISENIVVLRNFQLNWSECNTLPSRQLLKKNYILAGWGIPRKCSSMAGENTVRYGSFLNLFYIFFLIVRFGDIKISFVIDSKIYFKRHLIEKNMLWEII